MAKHIYLLLAFFLGTIRMFADGAYPVQYIGCTPESGSTITSFDSFALHFDKSNFFNNTDYEDDGTWGIAYSGSVYLYYEGDETEYAGGETGKELYKKSIKIDGTKEEFKVGTDFEFSLSDAEIKPNTKYAILLHGKFFAGKMGTTDATARSVSMYISQNPYITLHFTTSSTSEVKTCYLDSSIPSSGNCNALNDLRLTFNDDVQVNAGATATLTDDDTDYSIGTVNSTSMTVDPNDPKTVIVSFAEQTLYNAIKYTVTVPEGAVSLASDAEVSNKEFTLTYTGTEYRYFGVKAVTPAEDGTAIIPNVINVTPDFPKGCGFVYLSTAPRYEMKPFCQVRSATSPPHPPSLKRSGKGGGWGGKRGKESSGNTKKRKRETSVSQGLITFVLQLCIST